VFFSSLAIAIWFVYVFCQKRFAERGVTENSDYIYQLLPRQLATHEEYFRGLMIYFGSMAATVVLLSLLGPKNLGTFAIKLPDGVNPDAVSYATVPIIIAFVLMGALPNVPGLTQIDKYLREYGPTSRIRHAPRRTGWRQRLSTSPPTKGKRCSRLKCAASRRPISRGLAATSGIAGRDCAVSSTCRNHAAWRD
jgi:hypothetical protein